MSKRVKIYAVDFDGTIVEDAFPKIGKIRPEAAEFLKAIQSLGCQWVLWTCRAGDYLKEALDFCLANGLEPSAVNENVVSIVVGKGIDPRKIYADCYIDDHVAGGKAVFPPVPMSKDAHED